MNFLLSGPPRAGKTTVCRMILERFDRKVRGFVTEDIRHDGERVGFMVEFENGGSRVLSHVDYEEGPMVGKYTVDLETMDWVINTMEGWSADSAQLYVVDEIGKMELEHDDFADAVREVLDESTDTLATIPKVGPDFIGEILSRDDTEQIKMTEDNREEVLGKLVEKLRIRP